MYFFAWKYKYINYGALLMDKLHHTTLVYFFTHKYILIYNWLILTINNIHLYTYLYNKALYPIYNYLCSICICL